MQKFMVCRFFMRPETPASSSLRAMTLAGNAPRPQSQSSGHIGAHLFLRYRAPSQTSCEATDAGPQCRPVLPFDQLNCSSLTRDVTPCCLCLFVCCCLCPWHLGAWVLGGGDRGDVALSDVRLNHTCPSIHTLPVLPGLVPVFSARRAELVAPSCIFVL